MGMGDLLFFFSRASRALFAPRCWLGAWALWGALRLSSLSRLTSLMEGFSHDRSSDSCLP